MSPRWMADKNIKATLCTIDGDWLVGI